MTINTIVNTVTKFVSNNSTTILAGLATAGVVTTSVFAGKAAVKAHKILEAHPEAETAKDKTKLVWKEFIPPVIMATATAGCIIGGQSINLHRNAVLAGAYTLAETSLKEFKDQAEKVIGEEKVKEIKDNIIKDQIDKTPLPKNDVLMIGNGQIECFDPYSGRYFPSTAEDIKKAVNELNTQLFSDLRVDLNDFYYSIGLEPTRKTGSDLGWDLNDALDNRQDFPIEVRFVSHLKDDKTPCLGFELHPEPYIV